MTRISEEEFIQICDGIYEDREIIYRHNPIGTLEEVILWMLLSCLISYMNVPEIETPCFTGKPNADTYRKAILFVLRDSKTQDFDAVIYLDELIKKSI